MDIKATGRLICEARKAKGLTQKQLAEQLNLSDRTISRWERGVGFPDISLLEPLSAALDIPVLDLLRGEHREEALTPDAAVKETLDAVAQTRSSEDRTRRRNNRRALALFLAILLVISQSGLVFRPVSFTVQANVYEDGLVTEQTHVKLHGKIIWEFPFRRHFVGRIQTPHAQTSMAEGYYILWRFDIHPGKALYGGISLRSTEKYNTYHQDRREGDQDLRYPFVFSFSMKDFAFRLSDGLVVATSDEMYTQLAAHTSLPELKKPAFTPEY